MAVCKVALSFYFVGLSLLFTGCSTAPSILSIPMHPMGMEEGDAFTIVLQENGSTSVISAEVETEIGQCILSEIQKVKPSARFVLPGKFRSAAASELNIDNTHLCSDMEDWFSTATRPERALTTDPIQRIPAGKT